MLNFNTIAENAIEQEKQYYLNDIEIQDLIMYYSNDILKMIIEQIQNEENDYSYNREFSKLEIDAIENYLIDNCADLLSIGYGYHVITGYFSLMMSDEIEIDLTEYNLTDDRIEIINRYSDIYISDNHYGYITTDFHLDIRIDANQIEKMLSDTVLENIEYMENRFDTDILKCIEYQENRKNYL